MRYRLRTLLIQFAVLPLLLAGAGVELYRFLVLLQSDRHLPPTMYSQHVGLAVALTCTALIVALLEFRRTSVPAP